MNNTEERNNKEANYFAMHLLIPTQFLEKSLERVAPLDITNDQQIKDLANEYEVPIWVMVERIREYLTSKRGKMVI